jgi:hypothetical protein
VITRKKKAAHSFETLELTTKLNDTASEKVVMKATTFMSRIPEVTPLCRRRFVTGQMYHILSARVLPANRLFLSQLSPVYNHRDRKKRERREETVAELYGIKEKQNKTTIEIYKDRFIFLSSFMFSSILFLLNVLGKNIPVPERISE